MQKITPFLWFNDQAEEAVNFYLSIFKDAKILAVSHYCEIGPGPAGQVMTIDFQLAGQHFIALNGGPHFQFTEAISFSINCETQEEVDYFWERLTADGGQESECGWLKDKYGLSWQVVPSILGLLASGTDPVKVQRMTQALLQMKKLNIATLQRAYEQG